MFFRFLNGSLNPVLVFSASRLVIRVQPGLCPSDQVAVFAFVLPGILSYPSHLFQDVDLRQYVREGLHFLPFEFLPVLVYFLLGVGYLAFNVPL